MRVEGYSEQTLQLEGWPVRLTSYRIGPTYYAKADNVSPGAQIARAAAATLEQARREALDQARARLARTRVQAV